MRLSLGESTVLFFANEPPSPGIQEELIMSYSKYQPRVAYFCMEYGLGEDLPIMQGLGILAGDIARPPMT